MQTVTQGAVLHRAVADGLGFTLTAHEPHRRLDWHTEPVATLTLQLAGACDEDISGEVYTCRPGTLLFKPVGAPHRDMFGGDGGQAVIVELPEVLLAALGRGPGRKPVATATNAVTWALGLELYVAAREGRTGLQERAARLMGRLQANSAAELRLARCESWLRDVAEALRGCERGQRRSLAELSAEAQRHPIYLARAFRRVYGVSPREYRQCSRVEQAVPAVAFGEIELVDLALALGFADQSHLGRVFRRTVGMTPGRLRRVTRALLASV